MSKGTIVFQNQVMTVKMEANQYQAIKHYILISEYPKWMKTAREKSKQRQKVRKIILLEGQLFHEKKKDQPTLVIQKHQVTAILYMVYDHPIGGHRSLGNINQKIR